MRLLELLSQISNGASQIILILVGIAIVAILLSRKTREQVVGICAAAIGLDAKKRENKEKIGKIKNLQSVTQSDLTALEQSILSKAFSGEFV